MNAMIMDGGGGQMAHGLTHTNTDRHGRYGRTQTIVDGMDSKSPPPGWVMPGRLYIREHPACDIFFLELFL